MDQYLIIIIIIIIIIVIVIMTAYGSIHNMTLYINKII